VVLSFYFGDHSESHSEKYCLRLTPVVGSGIGTAPRTLSYVNANYGECETKTVALVPGWKYEISLHHAGTNLESGPDYDYTLMPMESVPTNVTIEDGESLFGVDDTSTAFSGAGKSASISIHAVTHVAVCAPDDSSWAELEEGRVILDNESLRVKVVVSPQLATLDRFCQMFGNTLTVKTSGTCPNGVQVPIGSDATIDGLSGEFRITKTRQQLIACGLLPSQNEDGVEESCAHDEGADVDSGVFLSGNENQRGRALVSSAGNLKATPPISIPSDSFFKAAGAEVVRVSCASCLANPRQIMNQADVLYYSGHGSSLTGSLKGPNGGSFRLTPAMVASWWNRDLNCVVFSACSVLDINDYNNNYDDPFGGHSHGRSWGQVGPSVVLGYNYIAPGDAGGATTRIISAWKNNRASGDIDAWMNANRDNKAWNACAIEKDVRYVYFKKQLFGRHKIKTVLKESW